MRSRAVAVRTGLPRPRAQLSLVAEAARHLAAHVRDRRFWAIQAMIIAATSAHYGIELLGDTNPTEPLHAVALTALIVPLVYAALNFGSAGAVLTAIWCGALALPALWVFHEHQAHWVIEVSHLGIILPVGVVVAWRVDREKAQRRRAEQTSASLALVNDVVVTLASSSEIEEQIASVLERLVSTLALRSITLTVEAGVLGREAWMSTSTAPATSIPRLVAASREPVTISLAGRAGHLGMLSARPRGAGLGGEGRHVLSAAAHALQVAIENASLRRQRQESLQLYAREVTQAHEDERLRLARELHDDTAQELVNLVRRLERISEEVPQGSTASLADAADLGRAILHGVRGYSYGLRPPVLDDLGVRAALEVVVQEMAARLPGGADLVVTGSARRLSGAGELALFRIAQEALRNVWKHADATRARVGIDFEPDRVVLTVRDDGHGFAVPADFTTLAHERHFGLVGMRERAELVGGRLSVRSDETGTTVVVTMPDSAATPGSSPERHQEDAAS